VDSNEVVADRNSNLTLDIRFRVAIANVLYLYFLAMFWDAISSTQHGLTLSSMNISLYTVTCFVLSQFPLRERGPMCMQAGVGLQDQVTCIYFRLFTTTC